MKITQLKLLLLLLSAAAIHSSALAAVDFDLTDSERGRRILEKAQALIENREMSFVDDGNYTQANFWDNTLSARLAESKFILLNLKKKVHMTVVIPVYEEVNRMMTKKNHEFGEDFVREKIRQLDWFADCPNFTWDIVIVDDGCPLKSGEIAQKIVKEFSVNSNRQWPVTIEFLEQGIQENKTYQTLYPAILGLSSTSESRKGGAVYFGLSKAILNHQDLSQGSEHIVIYTDADLSAHLGHVGFAVEQIINHGFDVSIGSRKLELTSTKGANTKGGKLWCYLWSNLFPGLNVTDTQVGFKAFRAQFLNEILSRPLIEYGLSFDVELLVLANQMKSNAIGEFVMTWIDSVAESKVKKNQEKAFFEMVRSLSRLYEAYGEKTTRSDSFSQLAESLSLKELDIVLKQCPSEIYEQPYSHLRKFKGVTAQELRTGMRHVDEQNLRR